MEEKVLNTILLEFQKLNERLDHIEKENENKFSLIDARFNTLEEIVLSMQKDIGSLQEQVTNLESRISNLEKSMQDIQNRLTKLEKVIENILNRMSQLEKVIEDILNRISQLENRLNSLEKITLRMEYTFNDKISALFDAHSYYSDQYQKLETRIRQNEMKVEKLSISHC